MEIGNKDGTTNPHGRDVKDGVVPGITGVQTTRPRR